MAVGAFKKKWYPDNQAKEQEHQGQQASGEKRHSIRKKGQCGEREENSRRYGPKHLRWREPLRNKGGGRGKIKGLFESKGSGTDAQKNAADAIPCLLRPCGGEMRINERRTGYERELLEEVAPAIVDLR